MEIPMTNDLTTSQEACLYPAFAISRRILGVTVYDNPDLEAPQRQRYVTPSVRIDGWFKVSHRKRFDVTSLSLTLRPASLRDPAPIVTIQGGPRLWWDLDHGFQDPEISLEALARLAQATESAFRNNGMFSFDAELELSTRHLTAASAIVKPARFAQPRQMIELEVGLTSLRPEGVVTWKNPSAENFGAYSLSCVLVDSDSLIRGVKLLEDAYEFATVTQVPYELRR
jgi:hypothetical protein